MTNAGATAKRGRPPKEFREVRFSSAMQEVFARSGLGDYRAGRLTAALLGSRPVIHADVGAGFVRVGVLLDVTERGRTDRSVRRHRQQREKIIKGCGDDFVWFVESIVALKGVVAALFDRDAFRLMRHLDRLIALEWQPILERSIMRLLGSSPVDPKTFDDSRAACAVIPASIFYGWRSILRRVILAPVGGADDGNVLYFEEKGRQQGNRSCARSGA